MILLRINPPLAVVGARLLVFLWLFLMLPALAASPKSFRPNIVYILADDMGIGDVSCLNPGSAWRTLISTGWRAKEWCSRMRIPPRLCALPAGMRY